MSELSIRDDLFDIFPIPNDNVAFQEYKDFIYKILYTRENSYFQYSDCHHILPRCIGGTDEGNLIYLTYREHFLAHYYLARAYSFNHDLVFTSVMMGSSDKGITKEEKAKYYEESRKSYIDLKRKDMSSESNPMKDLKVSLRFSEDHPEVQERFTKWIKTHNPMDSEESRRKVAESKEGKIWVNNGIEMTYINPEDLEVYQSYGYVKGMIKTKKIVPKNYDCHCRVCGKEYKGGKYSTVCRECYSEMKRIEKRRTQR